MIGIVDYGVGNIKAFENIYKNLGMVYKNVKNKDDFRDVTKIILPGVGAFDWVMTSLQKSGMREKLDELVLDKRIPVLGICVGMQMLAKNSDEGKLLGLNWIDGVVKKFDPSKIIDAPLPHMGWNNLNIKKQKKIVKNIRMDSKFYFLHSYYFECENKDNVIATTVYGEGFESIVNNKNIYGIQCHPEKSHWNGIQFLKNFGEL